MVWLECKNYLRLAKFKYQGLTIHIYYEKGKEKKNEQGKIDKKKHEFKGQKIKADKMACA